MIAFFSAYSQPNLDDSVSPCTLSCSCEEMLVLSHSEIRNMPYAHAQNKKNMAGEINSELLRIFHEN